MLPLLRGRHGVAWAEAEPEPSGAGPAPSAELHSGDAAQDAALARRFARALALRGHRPRAGRRARASPQSEEAQSAGRKRLVRTKNCAANRRDERRRRRALLDVALASTSDGTRSPARQDALAVHSTGLRLGAAQMDESQLLGAIRSLQADIAQLERSTSLRASAFISWRTNRSGAALDIANEYIMRISGGYDPCNALRVGPSAAGRGFMEALLLPDVQCRDFQGVESFLNQWEKYTIFHDNFACRLSGMRMLKDSDSLVSVYIASDFQLTITDATVKFLYPALDTEARRDARTRAIVDRLVGARVRLPMDIVLHFNERGRVFAFESRSHLATALLEVLEDPADAMHVFCLANMTADGHWKLAPDPDAPARQRRLPHTLL